MAKDTAIKAAIAAQLRAVCARWRAGEITATAAMQEVGLKPNIFYRRVKQQKQ